MLMNKDFVEECPLFYMSTSKTISILGFHFLENTRQILKDMEGFYV